MKQFCKKKIEKVDEEESNVFYYVLKDE